MKKVSIIGATFIGNRGAEAMLTTVIGRVRDFNSKIEFCVFSYYPKDDRKLIKDKQIKVYSATPVYLVLVLFPFSLALGILKFLRLGFLERFFPAAIRDLNASTVLIDLAGVSFIDGRDKFLPFNVLTIWPAQLLKVPVVKVAQALGPFNNVINKFCASVFLARCKKIFARGTKTLEHLKTLALGVEKVDPAADVAFLHKLGDSLTKEGDFIMGDKNKPVIGICPSSVVHKMSAKYLDFVVDLINKLNSKGFHVLLFPNATQANKMSKFRNNDLKVIALLKEKLADNADVTYITQDINTDVIKNLIKKCELVVVSRFHAMIAALSLTVPPLVLGWSHKYEEVMKMFELEKEVYDYNDIDVEVIVERVAQMLEDLENYQDKIRKHLPKVRELANRQIDYLISLLD